MVIGDRQSNIEDVIRLASTPEVSIHQAIDQDWSIELFDRHPCDVIILCHEKIIEAERFYMSLMMVSEKAMEKPHQVIVACDGKDVEKAYHLCKDEIFNDYVIIKPLFDIYRMKFAINGAMERLMYINAKETLENKLKKLAQKIKEIESDMENYFKQSKYFEELKENNDNANIDIIKLGLSKITEKIDVIKEERADEKVLNNVKKFEKEYNKINENVIDAIKEKNEDYKKQYSDLENKKEKIKTSTHAIAEEAKSSSNTQLKALVVEDEMVNQKIMSLILGNEGFEVKVAGDGLSAIKTAEAWNPNIIFMDIRMPKMNGLKVTKYLRKNQKFDESHIIMLTAHDSRAVVKECLNSGASDYLVKPAKKDEILQRLNLIFPNRTGS